MDMKRDKPNGILRVIGKTTDLKEQLKKSNGNLQTSNYREVKPDAAMQNEDDNYICSGFNPDCINGLITYEYRPAPYDDPQNRFAKYKPVYCSICQKGRQLKDEWETEEANNRRNYLLKQSYLPISSIFNNLTLESYALTPNGTTKWFKEVKRWVENWSLNNEKGLILYGKCGVGKTGLVVAALKELINQHFASVFYITVGDFVERVGEAWTGRKGDDHILFRVMCEADVLFLDEVGTGHPKVNEVGGYTPLGNLFKIIDFRYRYGKPIILATNRETPAELMEALGEKNFNRIFETSIQLLCVGRNLRG
jgi:DNA replication protein DnaC